ncbi:MAG TPA: hypothetical protein VKZ18_27130 [Polyangia bacterium]|nr:hypothetical protein [Polyangia bacterium]
MASKHLALAQPLFISSTPSKKKKRSRGRKRHPAGAAPPAAADPGFDDLEQAFFDAAPPEAPAVAELESFDDLGGPPVGRPDLFGAWRQALASVAAELAQLAARLRAQRGAAR